MERDGGPGATEATRRRLRVELFVVVFLVGAAFITSIAGTESIAQTPTPTPDQEDSERQEVVRERTRFSKTFVNGDGSYTAEISPEQIHFSDDGKMREIETTLEPCGDTSCAYKNVRGPMIVRFAATGAGDPLVWSETNGRSVGFGVEDANPAAIPEVDENVLIYREILPGHDLKFEVNARHVKAYLILNVAPLEPPVYRFPLFFDNVSPGKTNEGDVAFKTGDGTTAFRMPRLFMFDSSDDDRSNEPALSEKVALGLESDKRRPVAKVTPDFDWLADPARVYPVQIDPTLVDQPSPDTFIQSNITSSPQYSETLLKSGTYNGGSTKARSLLKFQIGSIPGSAIIDSAKLRLWNFHSWSCTPGGNEIQVHRIRDDWTRDVLWSNRPRFGAVKNSRNNAHGYDSTCPSDWVELGVKPTVEYWRNNSGTNLGFGIRAENESDNYGWRKFRSKNASSHHPKLEIVYNTPPKTPTSLATTPACPTTSVTPELSGVYDDVDAGDGGRLEFKIFDVTDAKLVIDTKADDGNGKPDSQQNGSFANPGETSKWTVPTKLLTEGHTYEWQANAFDHKHYSGWSDKVSCSIEDTSPTTPMAVASTTHVKKVPSRSRAVTMTWLNASERVSGIDGYSWEFTESRTPPALTGIDTDSTGAGGYEITHRLPDNPNKSVESWFFHIAAIDNTGNASEPVTYGPIIIDPNNGLPVPLSPTLEMVAAAHSDELGLERFYPYRSMPLGTATSYVNLATGNAIVQQDAVQVPGVGLNVVLRHTYNSERARPSLRQSHVGKGWSLSVTDADIGIEGFHNTLAGRWPDADSLENAITGVDLNAPVLVTELRNASLTVTGFMIEFTDGDGTTHRFVRNCPSTFDSKTCRETSGRWDSPPGVSVKVRERRDPTTKLVTAYKLIRPDGVTYTAREISNDLGLSSGIWGVATVRDRDGNELTFDYDSPLTDTAPMADQLLSVRLAAISHNAYAANPVVELVYDANNWLDRISSLPNAPDSADPATGQQRRWARTVEYSIDADGLLQDVTRNAHEASTDSDNTHTDFTYADNDDLTPTANASQTARDWRVLEGVTDARDNSTTLLYEEHAPDKFSQRVRLTAVDDRRGSRWDVAHQDPDSAGAHDTIFTPPDNNSTTYTISPRQEISDGDRRIAGANITRIADAGNDKGSVVNDYTWTQNRLTAKTNGVGNKTKMRYNDLGLLIEVDEPPLNVSRGTLPDGAPTSRIVTTMSYTSDTDHQIANCTKPTSSSGPISTGGYCATVMDLTKAVYGSNVSGQKRVTEFGYDGSGNIETATARDGAATKLRTITMTYWGAGLLRKIDGPRSNSDVAVFGDASHVNGTITDSTYGGYHNSGQPRAIKDPKGALKRFSYTPYGMLGKSVDRAGKVTTTEYNERDLPVSVVDPSGDEATTTYDVHGNVEIETSPRGNETADPDDFETRHQYNANDWLIRTSTPGQTEAEPRWELEVIYNADGTKDSEREKIDGTRTAVTNFTYYPNDSLKTVDEPAGSGDRAVTTNFYDLAGRLAKTKLPRAKETTTAPQPKRVVSYTPQGQPARIDQTAPKNDANGSPVLATVRYAYNAHGEQLQSLGPRTNSAGVTEEQLHSYNPFGEATAIKRRLTATKLLVHSFTYDEAGNRTKAVQPAGSGGSLTTTYTYNSLNRLVSQSDPFNPGHRVSYTYLAEGQQKSRFDWHDPDGTGSQAEVKKRTTTRTYNDDYTIRREVTTKHPSGKTIATCNWEGTDASSGYDANDNLLDSRTVKGTDGCTGGDTMRDRSFVYDHQDRLERVVQTVDIPGDVADGVTRTQFFDWRLDGVLESSTWKEGAPSSVGAEYVTGYEHSNGKLLETVTDWRGATDNRSTFDHVPAGDLIAARLGTDGTTTPDATLNLARYVNGSAKKLSWTHGSTTLREHGAISYNVAGLRTSENVTVQPPHNETMDDTSGVARFKHDLAARLTSWTSPFDMADLEGTSAPPTHDYTLDDAGNITKETVTAGGSQRQSITATYIKSRLDHRTIKSKAAIVPGDSATTTEQDFFYTAVGEEKRREATVTTDVDGLEVESDAQIRCYDAAARTRRVIDVAVGEKGCPSTTTGKKVDYLYAEDQVVARTSEGATPTNSRLFFYYGASQTLAEETAPDGETRVRYLVTADNQTLAQQKPGATHPWVWLLRDADNNVATNVADGGVVTAQKAYDPYGATDEGGSKASQSDPKSDLGFQAAREDRATNNIFLGPRIYDPTTERFTTPDFFVASGPDLALGTDPLTGNRYLFAAANPVAFYENGYYPVCDGHCSPRRNFGQSYGGDYNGGGDDTVSSGFGEEVSKVVSGVKSWVNDPIGTFRAAAVNNLKNLRHGPTGPFVVPIVEPIAQDIAGGRFKKAFGRAFFHAVTAAALRGGGGAISGRTAATRGASTAARSMDDVLSGLRGGRSTGVRVVDSVEQLENIFNQLSAGGGPIAGTTYPGKLIRLPDGTTIGLRPTSRSGGPTIDIVQPGGPPTKIHVDSWTD